MVGPWVRMLRAAYTPADRRRRPRARRQLASARSWTSPGAWTTGSFPLRPRWPCAGLCWSPAIPASATPSDSWSGDAVVRPAVHAGRQLPCQVARTAHPMLAHSGRQADAERAAACAQDAVAPMGGLRMATAMAERAAAAIALEAGDATRRAPGARVGSSRGQAGSRPRQPSHAASRGVRSRGPVNPNAPPRRSTEPPWRFATPAAR